MNLLNQFSYPLIGVGVFVFSYLTLTRVFNLRWYVITTIQLGITALFISGFVVLSPQDNIINAEDALLTIDNGRPTLVAFFSNYCTGCLALNPIVNQIEADIRADFDVLRIDIHTERGRTLREALGFSFTPEFVLYDANGQEIWRDHIPPTTDQIDAAR
jgi:thiol-disulfide isomerase/thioredoxin